MLRRVSQCSLSQQLNPRIAMRKRKGRAPQKLRTVIVVQVATGFLPLGETGAVR